MRIGFRLITLLNFIFIAIMFLFGLYLGDHLSPRSSLDGSHEIRLVPIVPTAAALPVTPNEAPQKPLAEAARNAFDTPMPWRLEADGTLITADRPMPWRWADDGTLLSNHPKP